MLRVYALVLSGIVAVGSAVAYSMAERWISYMVVAAAALALLAFIKAVRVQRDLDAHLEATREAVADVRSKAQEIRRTIDEG